MPHRELVEARLADLRRERALIEDFQSKWSALLSLIAQACSKSELPIADFERFDQSRAELNRLYPHVSHRLQDVCVERRQFGRWEPLHAFNFLLTVVPSLSHLCSRTGLTDRVGELLGVASAALERSLGTLDRDIAKLESGPSVLDSLAAQAEPLGLGAFLAHLGQAEAQLGAGEFRAAIHSARLAIERLVTEMANRLASPVPDRQFRDALGLLESNGLIDEGTRNSIAAPKVGFWGWTSQRGAHDEHDPSEASKARSSEARLGIEWARAIAEYLLSQFTDAAQVEQPPRVPNPS